LSSCNVLPNNMLSKDHGSLKRKCYRLLPIQGLKYFITSEAYLSAKRWGTLSIKSQ
jgi:hypothetical protein